MNDRLAAISLMFDLNYFHIQIHFKAELPFVLAEESNSTVCLPLLYGAMIHSTSSKAQKHDSRVLFFSRTFHRMNDSRYFPFFNFS